MILDSPQHSDKKKQKMLKNLEYMWEQSPDIENTIEDDIDEPGNDYESEGYCWPEISLAHSQTFFGLDDAGHLSYEIQETLAEEKYDVFVLEIDELLGKGPDVDLFPVDQSISNDN